MHVRPFAAILCAALTLLPLVGFAGGSAITNPTPQRAFVATYGSDSNNCGLAAPCRTLNAALLQVNAGGEILVLDSGGFGALSNNSLAYITQSITITVPNGIYAGISAPLGVDGVLINAPGAVVTLRGLTINSQVVGTTGGKGVNITAADQVNIENCVIDGFPDSGVYVNNGPVTLKVANSTFHNDHFAINLTQTGYTGALPAPTIHANISGVAIESDPGQPGGAGTDFVGVYANDGTVVTVSNSRILGQGLGVISASGGSPSTLVLEGSEIGANVDYGVWLYGGPQRAVLRDNVITGTHNPLNASSGIGVYVSQTGNTVSLSHNVITGNNIGVSVDTSSSPVVQTYGDNTIDSNTTNILGTLTTVTSHQ